GNDSFRRIFDISPPPAVDGEYHDTVNDRWYVLHSHPLCWMDGRPASLCILTDVTEERRARELIAKHRDAAHRTARLIALGEFASAVAHELNQPLAAIATYNHAALLLVETATPRGPELREAMEKCRDQARRAGAIIQRLKELLRHPTPALI